MTCRTTHHLACDCREAEFAAKDKRIAELEAALEKARVNDGFSLAAIEQWKSNANAMASERDALAELVREVHDGHYDMRSEFVASPDWLARARAAIGETP